MAQPFVVVQRLANGNVRVRNEVGSEALVVDMAAMTAEPMLAIRYVARLMSFRHPDAFPIIEELLAWFEANAVASPTPEPAG